MEKRLFADYPVVVGADVEDDRGVAVGGLYASSYRKARMMVAGDKSLRWALVWGVLVPVCAPRFGWLR